MSINEIADDTYVKDLRRIKNQIEDNDNINVRYVAERVGISKSSLYSYLNFESMIPYDVYLKIKLLLANENPV